MARARLSKTGVSTAAHGRVATLSGSHQYSSAGKTNGEARSQGTETLRSFRPSWVDIAWVVFVGLNLAAMRLLPDYQTVPFLLIWVSLTATYGFRLWRLQPTILTIAAVTLATAE